MVACAARWEERNGVRMKLPSSYNRECTFRFDQMGLVDDSIGADDECSTVCTYLISAWTVRIELG